MLQQVDDYLATTFMCGLLLLKGCWQGLKVVVSEWAIP